MNMHVIFKTLSVSLSESFDILREHSFPWVYHFLLCDLNLGVQPIFENVNLANNF